ncbi:hypothetical protein [Streptomyces chrestomyceticus]|uniref:Uncharacterized protein n=1 Tax=Streptomyces chrestomyceticus TaxID=68185 RepID=A0ABU7X0H6_9ACTN
MAGLAWLTEKLAEPGELAKVVGGLGELAEEVDGLGGLDGLVVLAGLTRELGDCGRAGSGLPEVFFREQGWGGCWSVGWRWHVGL